MSVKVGLSGFSYKEWQGEGLFYPPELKQKQYLSYYSERFPTVEADGTWYRMPGEGAVAGWISGTPDGFQFAPKMHRNVTHISRLKPDSLDSVRFFLKRLRPMADAGKLGPILIQLPPNLKRDDDRLRAFLEALPRTMGESAVASGETPIDGPGKDILLNYALEFRNDTWNVAEVEGLLRSHEIAWVGADTDDDDAICKDTGRVLYVRLRKSDYDEAMLKDWADYFLASGKDAYVYCKHQDAEQPWVWADGLIRLTNLGEGI